MRSSMASLVGGLASVLIALCAWTDARAQDGTIAPAPPLSLAGDGPITATFLGASQPFVQLSVGWVSSTGVSANGFFFGFSDPAPGTQFQITPTTGPGGPVAPGADVFFNARFADPADASQIAISSTAVSPDIAASLRFIAPELPLATVLFNTGVIQTGPGSLLIGFNPPGFGFPTSFDGFGLRIAVDNVCIG